MVCLDTGADYENLYKKIAIWLTEKVGYRFLEIGMDDKLKRFIRHWVKDSIFYEGIVDLLKRKGITTFKQFKTTPLDLISKNPNKYDERYNYKEQYKLLIILKWYAEHEKWT